ncbi:MAG: hypothetical protein ACR2FR_00500 [Rubrobacter sp.]
MAAEDGSQHEASRGDTNFLPKPTHNRSKDPAAEAASARRRGGRPRVLMANEPRAYREGIAAVISQLRPEVEIETVEPAALDTSIERFSPDMVICSKATDALKGGVRVWVELYPENAAFSVASIGGRRMEFTEIQLPDLLSIVDKAEELAGTN